MSKMKELKEIKEKEKRKDFIIETGKKVMKDTIVMKRKESYIESLINGTTRKEASEAAGVCTTTIWNWRKDDQEFAKAVEVALEERIQIAEDSLYENVKKGNVIAQIFWLKNRASKRWRDKQELEVVMPKVIHEVHFIQSGLPPVIKEEPELIEDQEKN